MLDKKYREIKKKMQKNRTKKWYGEMKMLRQNKENTSLKDTGLSWKTITRDRYQIGKNETTSYQTMTSETLMNHSYAIKHDMQFNMDLLHSACQLAQCITYFAKHII